MPLIPSEDHAAYSCDVPRKGRVSGSPPPARRKRAFPASNRATHQNQTAMESAQRTTRKRTTFPRSWLCKFPSAAASRPSMQINRICGDGWITRRRRLTFCTPYNNTAASGDGDNLITKEKRGERFAFSDCNAVEGLAHRSAENAGFVILPSFGDFARFGALATYRCRLKPPTLRSDHAAKLPNMI